MSHLVSLPLKVLHIIPAPGIGGVELAAESVARSRSGLVHYETHTILRKRTGGVLKSLHLIAGWWLSLRRMMKEQPDVVVLSLWMSAILALPAKLVLRKAKVILFLHSTKDAHLLDLLVTRVAYLFCDYTLADSVATSRRRIRNAKVEVVPLYLSVRSGNMASEAKPMFIFWGRLNKVKDLSYALQVFRSLAQIYPEARYSVIGPDDGDLANLERLVLEWGLREKVTFLGPLERDHIFQIAGGYSFFLMTSIYEGMSIATIEAMQLGLVPIVTPVGEIGSYCRDLENSILLPIKVDDWSDSLRDRIADIVGDHEKFSRLSEAARATWNGQYDFSATLPEKCIELFSRELPR